jgi:hypothetical protein
MSKMGLHDPFGYLKHKLWLKEMDFRPLKVKNWPDLLVFKWCASTIEKLSMRVTILF